jgi:hypothetical protein
MCLCIVSRYVGFFISICYPYAILSCSISFVLRVFCNLLHPALDRPRILASPPLLFPSFHFSPIIASALPSNSTNPPLSFQGISRSAAVVIAYLIREHGQSYEQAHAFVKSRRACIKPNSGFVAVLKEWEKMVRAGEAAQQAAMQMAQNGGGGGGNRPDYGRRHTAW